MPGPDNLHSHIVAWLKILLPLAALALLSSVFLVARRGGDGTSAPFTRLELKEMASEQRVDKPDFASVTEDGRRILISADLAIPRSDDPDIFDGTGLHGQLQTRDGGTVDVTSDSGTVFSDRSQTILRGNVHIVTSTGYHLTTDELVAAMDRTDMETTGPVSGHGPLGTIDAGRMSVIANEGAEEEPRVVFKDGVKLIYFPKTP